MRKIKTRRIRRRRLLCRKQKTARKHKGTRGGKVSGRGAFGCVIQPPVPCSNGTFYKDAQLAVKLYAPSVEARNKNRIDPAFPTEERKAAEILRRIPAGLQYFVIPFDDCEISEADVERHEDTRECAEQMRLYPKKLLWMQAAEGDLWKALFQDQRLFATYTPTEILEALRTLLLGIRALHEAGVIHRDIKPDNVLWGTTSQNGRLWIKLADFGEAMLDAPDFATLVQQDLQNLLYVFQFVFTKLKVQPQDTEAFRSTLQQSPPMYDAMLAEYEVLAQIRAP